MPDAAEREDGAAGRRTSTRGRTDLRWPLSLSSELPCGRGLSSSNEAALLSRDGLRRHMRRSPARAELGLPVTRVFLAFLDALQRSPDGGLQARQWHARCELVRMPHPARLLLEHRDLRGGGGPRNVPFWKDFDPQFTEPFLKQHGARSAAEARPAGDGEVAGSPAPSWRSQSNVERHTRPVAGTLEGSQGRTSRCGAQPHLRRHLRRPGAHRRRPRVEHERARRQRAVHRRHASACTASRRCSRDAAASGSLASLAKDLRRRGRRRATTRTSGRRALRRRP